MAEGVVEYAHFLLSFSHSTALFLSLRRTHHIPANRSVLPSLIWSLFTCRFTKCSHFKQYPGYSCALVRRPSRAHTRSDMNTPPKPLAPLRPTPPFLPLHPIVAGELVHCHRLSTFSYQPAIPSRAFFITASLPPWPLFCRRPKGPRVFFRHAADIGSSSVSSQETYPLRVLCIWLLAGIKTDISCLLLSYDFSKIQRYEFFHRCV